MKTLLTNWHIYNTQNVKAICLTNLVHTATPLMMIDGDDDDDDNGGGGDGDMVVVTDTKVTDPVDLNAIIL